MQEALSVDLSVFANAFQQPCPWLCPRSDSEAPAVALGRSGENSSPFASAYSSIPSPRCVLFSFEEGAATTAAIVSFCFDTAFRFPGDIQESLANEDCWVQSSLAPSYYWTPLNTLSLSEMQPPFSM